MFVVLFREAQGSCTMLAHVIRYPMLGNDPGLEANQKAYF